MKQGLVETIKTGACNSEGALITLVFRVEDAAVYVLGLSVFWCWGCFGHSCFLSLRVWYSRAGFEKGLLFSIVSCLGL